MTLASAGDDESHPSIVTAMLTEVFHPAASAVATAAIAAHGRPSPADAGGRGLGMAIFSHCWT